MKASTAAEQNHQSNQLQRRQVYVHKTHGSYGWNLHTVTEVVKVTESRSNHQAKKFESDPYTMHGPPDCQNHFKSQQS